MSKSKILILLISCLLLAVAVEFGLIYIFDVDATILLSFKYIIPLAMAAALVLALVPARFFKLSSKRKRKPHEKSQ